MAKRINGNKAGVKAKTANPMKANPKRIKKRLVSFFG